VRAEWQSACLTAQAAGDLGALYKAVLPVAKTQVQQYARKLGKNFDLDGCAHDAATLFIEENYLCKKSIIRYFYPMVLFEVQTILFGRKRGRHSKNRIYEQQTYDISEEQFNSLTDIPIGAEAADERDYFLDILTSHWKSQAIIYLLYKEKYYANAIKKIAIITGRPYCYQYAVQLFSIWRRTK